MLHHSVYHVNLVTSCIEVVIIYSYHSHNFVIFTSQIVIERANTERQLPLLDKTKFLVPEELTMSQLTAILR